MDCTPSNHPDRFLIPIGANRSPKRISITVPHRAYEQLLDRSNKEGRSLSNLAAFLLESAINSPQEPKKRMD